MAKDEAVDAIVSEHVQEVEHRAVVIDQANPYNLARSAKNTADMTVQFTMPGGRERIDSAHGTTRKGAPKSSNVKVVTKPTEVASDL